MHSSVPKYKQLMLSFILNSIELTTLNDITKSVRIYYDPDDKNTIIEDDKELPESRVKKSHQKASLWEPYPLPFFCCRIGYLELARV